MSREILLMPDLEGGYTFIALGGEAGHVTNRLPAASNSWYVMWLQRRPLSRAESRCANDPWLRG
jgi:hypothetical protein